MKIHTLTAIGSFGLLIVQVSAQSVLFDFDNVPLHSGLPSNLTVGGITAQFSSTGQGFSIQAANTMGFAPVGFSGNCIYPNSVYAADLIVGFTQTLTDFSILYAPQELACDSSARMKVTAYMNGVLVGANTAIADPPGTWPTATLTFSSTNGFNNVVVHYDAPPPTGGDWGPIFMADNMKVTAMPSVGLVLNAVVLSNGAYQLSFTHMPGATLNVLATSDLTLPMANWSVLGPVMEIASGQYQFTDTQAANNNWRFYCVRSP